MFNILRQFDMAYTHFAARLGEMDGISDEEGEKLMAGYDSASSANKGSANLGATALVIDQIADRINSGQMSYVEKLSVTASATGGIAFTSIPVGAEIVDITVQCTSTNGSGTLKLTDGTNDISDTIACATLDAIDRAVSIDQTYKYVGADGVTVVANGNDDRGDMYVFFNGCTSQEF